MSSGSADLLSPARVAVAVACFAIVEDSRPELIAPRGFAVRGVAVGVIAVGVIAVGVIAVGAVHALVRD